MKPFFYVMARRILRVLGVGVLMGMSLSSMAKTNDDSADAAKSDVYNPTEYETLLPKIDLTGLMLNQILAAEFQFKTGNWQPAYSTYLTLALRDRDPRLAKRASEIALSANQMTAALTAAELWLKQSPLLEPYRSDAELVVMRLYLQQGRFADAKPLFTRRLRLMRFDDAPIAPIFEEMMTVTDKKSALRFLQESLSRYQSYVDVHIILANAAIQANEPAIAKAEAQRALELNPDNETALLLYGRLSDELESVLSAFNEFLLSDPGNDKVRVLYAQKLMDARDFAGAQKQYQILLERNPNTGRYLYALGLSAMEAKQPQQAEKYLKDFLAVEKTAAEEVYELQARGILSEMYARQNNYSAALDAVGQSANEISRLPQISRRAYYLMKLNRAAEGRTLIAQIPVADDEQELQRLIAEVQFLRESKDKLAALTLLKNNETKFGDDADFLYEYALMAELDKQLPLMEKKLRKLIEIAPQEYRGYNALGYAFAERNIKMTEAEELLKKALELTPKNPFVMDSWGWLKFRQGNLNDAEMILQNAYSISADTDIALHLAEVLWAKDLRDDAVEILRKIKTETSKNQSLNALMKRLGLRL